MSKKIHETWVSSDCDKILRYSKLKGASIIKRPAKYSQNISSSEDAWKHAINFIKKRNFILILA